MLAVVLTLGSAVARALVLTLGSAVARAVVLTLGSALGWAVVPTLGRTLRRTAIVGHWRGSADTTAFAWRFPLASYAVLRISTQGPSAPECGAMACCVEMWSNGLLRRDVEQ